MSRLALVPSGQSITVVRDDYEWEMSQSSSKQGTECVCSSGREAGRGWEECAEEIDYSLVQRRRYGAERMLEGGGDSRGDLDKTAEPGR